MFNINHFLFQLQELLNKLPESYFSPSLRAVYLWLLDSSIICISDIMSNNTLKCHFMVTSMNDSINYATHVALYIP